MIHVIPHHIRRGSWPPWHKLIHFNEDFNILGSTDIYDIECDLDNKNHKEFLDGYLKELNIKPGDCIFLDFKYFGETDTFEQFKKDASIISKKYESKLFIIDDDNKYESYDCMEFTYFSNRFDIRRYRNNFNYFRYRTPYHTWTNNIPELFNPFLYNLRQKKFNFIVGVDKIERLLSLKHIIDNDMLKDGYVGYSGFNQAYNDSEISDKLIEFRKSTLPIICDTPFERSEQGAVNVEFPPIPLCLNSYVSCICETMICEGGIVHLSEKSWNPFISHNIPLILGSSFLTNYLRQMGFWLAEDLFDISTKNTKYEIIEQYKSNLNILNSMSYDSLHDYYMKHQAHIMRNFDILIKQKFIFNRNNYK